MCRRKNKNVWRVRQIIQHWQFDKWYWLNATITNICLFPIISEFYIIILFFNTSRININICLFLRNLIVFYHHLILLHFKDQYKYLLVPQESQSFLSSSYSSTNFKDQYKYLVYLYILAWEPSVAQGTRTPAVYPHLLINFSYVPFKNRPTQFGISKFKLRTFPWFSQIPHSKFEANLYRCSWVMIGQANSDYYFTCILITQPLFLHLKQISFEFFVCFYMQLGIWVKIVTFKGNLHSARCAIYLYA